MKLPLLLVLSILVAALVVGGLSGRVVQQQIAYAQSADEDALDPNSVSILAATEAPTGFDNLTNGVADQTTFLSDRAAFDQVETITDGLGPVYNAQSCRECHQNPISGAISQIRELRAGHLDGFGNFVGATVTLHDSNGAPVVVANRSLINQRAICPGVDVAQRFNFPNAFAQERITTAETIVAPRTSLNLLGDGFLEAIANGTITNLATTQCNQTGGAICGLAISVPVLEAPGHNRIGRFGWKNQMPSLLSFSSDAYLNEMGITNRFNPNEVTTLCDIIPDPEDKTGTDGLQDIDHFARFMRATKAPPRDATLVNDPDVLTGQQLFHQVGCDICHVSTLTTAPTGTVINGGAFVVPAALGDKIIHPFSDLLLHDVGTGDNIVQNGGPDSGHRMRTAPLWGVRMRNELMHDGRSTTFHDAILRHGGAATPVTNNFRSLSDADKNRLIKFLLSL
jgi:CxxC motif-containing protein (DUF1111 family)